MTTRREALKKIFESGKMLGLGGLIFGIAANESANSQPSLRPPSAMTPDIDFLQACLKCGQCVNACDYQTLKLASVGDGKTVGTPYFVPRDIPCYMCTDIPCVKQCPSGALDLKRLIKETKHESSASIENAQMGLAVIHKETCLAYWGVQCDACFRACPLMNKALTLRTEINKTTGKHANILPIVNSDFCTGCGVCEHVCLVEKPAIFVLPRAIATGKVGNHYIKSWEKKDEKRIRPELTNPKDKSPNNSELQYLNNDSEF